MANGLFKIQEIPPGGAPGDGECFTWTADKKMPTEVGGARCAPIGAWSTGGKQRTERTDYPGARLPSEQVLGPVHKPFSWRGNWCDKYNFSGFALKERDRFAGMVRRGNAVRVSYGEDVYFGIIIDWDFPLRRKWDIDYAFEVSVHSKSGEEKYDKATEGPANPAAALDNVTTLAGGAAKEHARKPAWAVKTPIIGQASDALAQVSNRIDRISKSLDTRTGVLKPISDAKNLALQFRSLQGDCQGVVLKLVEARADIDMGARTAMDVLNFDVWTRSTMRLMRLAAHTSRKQADALDAMDHAATMTLYRPRQGESLFSVSRKAYGTPNAWRTIYEHNRLSRVIMDGTEVLVIPEKGRA